MPISKQEGENRDEFVSRCISEEMSKGYPQDQSIAMCIAYADENFASATQSVSDATWSTEAPINVNLESYRDYPKAARENAQTALDWAEKNGWGSCGTDVGKQRANQLAKGEPISEETIARMASFERQRQNSDRKLGDGCGRLMWLAWGGDEGVEWAQRKLRQIRNSNFRSQRTVIFNEDFNEDVVREYKEKGFKVQIRSSRKIYRKDKKVWNKLRSVGLTEDALVFGELRDLNKRYDYDMMFTGEDPMLEKLLTLGSVQGKYIGEPVEINSMEEAIKAQDLVKTVELKFVTVSVVYVYQERPNVAPAESGSRPFCTRLLSTPNREYTLDEIQNLPVLHLKKMGLPEDPFLYRGGFYTTPGGVRGVNTTPFCRHQWVAKVKIS
jgi:hypothetical protein